MAEGRRRGARPDTLDRMFPPVLASTVSAALLALSARGDDPLPAADPAVTQAALEHHVRFLASDELLGRAAGTPESARASAYLARCLARAGVEAAGDDGTYFQAVPLLRTTYAGVPELRLLGADGDSKGDAVALAHGPEFTVDVQGDPRSTPPLRLLLVEDVDDVPAEPSAQVALVVSSSRARGLLRELEERGQEDARGWGLVVRLRPDRTGRSAEAPRSRLERAWLADEDAPEVVTIHGAAADDVWNGRHERIALAVAGSREPVEERNVVGVVRGAGTAERPELAGEVLVLSAHFDHVGVVPGADPRAAEQDVIRNGADDDASGTAVLLELAEALAAGPPPARTVLFLFCAAEEAGMWGTSRFAERPTVPGRIVCNLNLEMLGMPDPEGGGVGKPWLTGFERSDLGPLLVEHGIDVGPDLRPELRLFFRSDNIVFARQGIVAQTLSTGGDNPNYHKVSDEPDTLDFEHMTTCARACLGAARLIADGSISPEWNEGEPQLER